MSCAAASATSLPPYANSRIPSRKPAFTVSSAWLHGWKRQMPAVSPVKVQPLAPLIPHHSSLTSSSRRIFCSASQSTPTNFHPHGLIWECLVEKAATVVFGLVLLAGSLRCRPAVAVPEGQAPSEERILIEEELNKKEVDTAEDGYLKILEKNPKDVEALKIILYGKMKKGKTAEAVDYVERLIKLEPDEVEWRLLQALSYELMGQLDKAKTLFKDILEERPLLIRALHGLALVMHKNREGSAVYEMLHKALEIARHEQRVTEERNIKILIAQMHVVKGDLKGGLELFQMLANENPRDFRPFLCQGIIYSLLDKKREADEQFEIYRTLVPEEFPQRGFLDDAVLTAKTEPREQLQKEFDSEFSLKTE